MIVFRGFKEWIADLNLTSYKGLWSVWLWVATFVLVAILVLWGTIAPLPQTAGLAYQDRITPGVLRVLETWLWGLFAFSGIDAAQYIGKRATDIDLATAKRSPKVTVQEAATVVAEQRVNPPVEGGGNV